MSYTLVLALSFCNGLWCSGEVKEYEYPTQTSCEDAAKAYGEFYGDALKKFTCIPQGDEGKG